MNTTLTEQKIIEGNVIIDKFLGKELSDRQRVLVEYDRWNNEIYRDFDATDLKYHTSWDWFMGAYKKLSDWLQDQYRKPEHNKHSVSNIDLIEVDIHCAVREFDLLNAFKHLAKAIEAYNQQKIS